MLAFLHTLTQQKEKPDVMIFYNTGVKLALQGAETLPHQLIPAPKQIRPDCGICLRFAESHQEFIESSLSNKVKFENISQTYN